MASRAICTNEGRCRTEPVPPKLRVFEPEEGRIFEEGTRKIRITGELETASDAVVVSALTSSANGCSGGVQTSVTVRNSRPDHPSVLPFVLEDIPVDPGSMTLQIMASIGPVDRSRVVMVEVDCPGCAPIGLVAPAMNATVPALLLPRLAGITSRGVNTAIWRIRSHAGEVFDGTMSVVDGVFALERVPLFAGRNRVEVLVHGIGSGFGESRCTVGVNSAVARERGERVILTWDGANSDLDLHVVGPGGRFGDPRTSLSARAPQPLFGGQIQDDFEGFGPEVATLEFPPDGSYGVVVEAVFDGSDFGSDAILRLLHEGQLLTKTPIGPRFLRAQAGLLWIAGVLKVLGGRTTWHAIDSFVPARCPPTVSPEVWAQVVAPGQVQVGCD